MTTKNYLMLCELFHPNLHGFDEKSDPNIFGHYMVAYIKDNQMSDSESDYNDDDSDYSTDEDDEMVLDTDDHLHLENCFPNAIQTPKIKTMF
jgi:hypothetical protein